MWNSTLFNKTSQRCPWACVKRWVSNRALNCPRLMDDEQSCDGSAFQTAGAATWKLRQPSCVLVEGTSMSWRSAECGFSDQKCRRVGCRRCWSRQDSAHGHSQTQRLLFWTVALGANEARREGLAWCVHICQHRRPGGRQHSGLSKVDRWLVKRHNT